jgi:hypothetical protein
VPFLKTLKFFFFTDNNFFNVVPHSTVLNYFSASFFEPNWDISANFSNNNSNSELFSSGNYLSNHMRLRGNARNAIITYNAVQKVYKARFDEGRSNANFQDFSNSKVNYPFLTENKTAYESILNKNTKNFFWPALYNAS